MLGTDRGSRLRVSVGSAPLHHTRSGFPARSLAGLWPFLAFLLPSPTPSLSAAGPRSERERRAAG